MNLSVLPVRLFIQLSTFLLFIIGFNSTIYSQEMDPGCSQLFFSEYGEESGYPSDKYVEIYNPTDQVVDLSNYRLWKINNGGDWYEVQMSFSGATLAPGDTYVLAPDISNYDENVPNVDQWTGNLNVSGDDAIGLAYNGGSGNDFYLIDAIGDEGPSVGNGWDVAGVTAATRDHTLIRKPTVQGPNPDWTSSAGTDADDSEWIVTDFDLSDVGYHTMESCGEGEEEVFCGSNGPVIITGVGQGPLIDGSYPRFVELYCFEEVDFTGWSLRSHINGNAGVSQETDLTTLGTVGPGEFAYVIRFGQGGDALQSFLDWFELDQVAYDALNALDGPAPNINGDDAVTLFDGSTVVDAYGVVGTDGTGEVWEHTDGWAYRYNDTQADGSVFNVASWDIQPDALSSGNVNSQAPIPFPWGSYTCGDVEEPGDASISNQGGPTIADPCTCAGNGLFDEEVVVTSGTGLVWTVSSNTGYIDPDTGMEFQVGDELEETSPGSGVYTLVGQHADGVGYEITVQGGLPGVTPFYFLSIDNLCWYPYPSIDNLPLEICLSDDPITLEGSAQLGDGSGPATAESEVWSGAGVTGNQFDPAGLMSGPVTISYTFDALDDDPDEQHPGCALTVTEEITVLEGPEPPMVSDISVCPGGDTTIEPEQTGGGTGAICGTNSPVVITGVGQGDLNDTGLGPYPRFAELYTYEEVDFTNWELQSYINGSSTVTHTTNLSSLGIVPAGQYIYVIRQGGGGSNEQAFLDFFELTNFWPYTVFGSSPNVSGDDALTLYDGNQIVDAFGEVGVDGTGETWEYTIGWAYRNNETEPDGSFVEADWTILPGVMSGGGTNSTAQVPFPTGTYSCSASGGDILFNFYGDAGLTNLLNPVPVTSFDPGPVMEGASLTIYVTAVDANGCESTAVPVTVSVFNSPELPVVEDITVCPGENTTIIPEQPTGGGTPVSCGSFSPVVISGLGHGDLGSQYPRFAELYTYEQVDFTGWSLRSHINGDASVTQETDLSPLGTIAAGEYIYVVRYGGSGFNEQSFLDWFELSPTQYAAMNTVTGPAPNVNGNDAVTLYDGSQVVDVYGVLGVNGNGETWNYEDGWAYRYSNTEPLGSFNEPDWTILHGASAGGTNNSNAPIPFPMGTYQCGGVSGTLVFNFYADAALNVFLAGPVSQYNPGTIQATSPQSIWVTAVDENGCESEAVEVVVTVEDDFPPTFDCPGQISVLLNPGLCSDFVSWDIPDPIDNCTPPDEITMIQTSGPVPGSELFLDESPYYVEYFIEDSNGNSAVCAFEIILEGYPEPVSTMVCNDEVQISLTTDCTVELNGDMFLEGGPYPCYNVFEIYVDGYEDLGNLANVPTYFAPGSYMVTVMDGSGNGNNCMSTMVIEDKFGPTIVGCNIFVLNPTVTYPLNDNGYVHPDVSGYPSVLDNCDNWDLTYTDEYEFLGCEGDYYEVIHRHWTVVDLNNGMTDECTQEIYVARATIDDIEYPVNFDGLTNLGHFPMLECNSGYELDYYGNPSPEETGFPGVFSFNLPTTTLFFDNFESYPNGIDLNNVNGWDGIGVGGMFTAVTDPGNGANGSDRFGILDQPGWGAAVHRYNLQAGKTYEYSIWIKRSTNDNMKLQVRVNDQNLIEVPATSSYEWQKLTVEYVPPVNQQVIFRMIKNDGVMAVDDAQLLEENSNTEFEIVLPGNFEVFYHDQLYDLYCGTKILREWTVIDDCTGDIEKQTQIIRITDTSAPTFMAPDNITLNTKGYECNADFEVPVLMHLEDNCDNNPKWYVSIDNAYLTGDENGNGFVDADETWVVRDAVEGLHSLCYYAVDNCGNESYECIDVEVVDQVPPIPVCEQYKQVTLTPDGVAFVEAEDFNSGSYDNCGPVWVKVLRGSEYNNINALVYDGGCPDLNGDDNPASSANDVWFDDVVGFCCEDLENPVMVTLRVFEVDPGPGPISPYDMYNPNGRLYGKYNDCWSVVEVECKIPPQIVAPKSIEVSCEENLDPYQNTSLLPTVYGVCDYDLDYEDSNHIGDVCNGRIERVWTAVGCGKSTSFLQFIYLNAAEPFDPCTISFPADQTDITCPNATGDPGYPTWDENPCNIVTAEIVNIDTFTFVEDACYKIVIDWAVIDWCEYDPNTGAEDNVDEVRNRKLVCNELVVDGYYRYTQILMVTDVYAPEIHVEDQCVGINAGCYAEDVVIGASATDTCNVDQKFWWKYIVTNMDTWETVQYSYNYEPVPQQGVKGSRSKDDLDATAEASLQLLNPIPMGNYRVTWTVGDGCGNANSAHQYFTVVDKKPPTPFMVDVSTATMSNCMIEVCAIQFDKGACDGDCLASYDNCSDLLYFTFTNVPPSITRPDWLDQFGLYYFNPETGEQYNANTGRAKYLAGEAHAWDPVLNSSCKVFTYQNEEPPAFELVQIYVWDQPVPNAECDDGNYDFAEIELYINTEGDDCYSSGNLVMSGTMAQSETGENIEDVVVGLDNENSSEFPRYTMSEEGGYAFFNLSVGNYELSAEKNDDYGNGVSTLDLVLIQKHLLGISPLDNVYDLIAADANLNGSISAADLFDFRKLILGVTDELSGGKSWRFIDESYAFGNANSPWAEMEYAEQVDLTLVHSVEGVNMIGVKLGDINGSAIANAGAANIEPRSSETRSLAIEARSFEAGIIEVPVLAEAFNEVSGMQFTLQTEGMAYAGVEPGALNVTNANIGLPSAQTITFSWNEVNAQSVASGEVLFTLKLEADRAGNLSDRLSMSSAITGAELYEGEELAIYDLALTFNGMDQAEFALYQNEPNPFTEVTEIAFNLPEAVNYKLSLYDVTGKVLKQIEGEGMKGMNTVRVKSEELPAGVLYYQLDAGEDSATMKMIRIQ